MTDRQRTLYQELRKKVLITFGLGDPASWTQKHFQSLSEEIQKETGQYLSTHTLRRIFDRLPNPSEIEYLPQTATLDILCRYAGLENWFQINKEFQVFPSEPDPFLPQKNSPSFRKTIWNQTWIRILLVGSLVLAAAFILERRLYLPKLEVINNIGKAPFRVLLRLKVPYIGYHKIQALILDVDSERKNQTLLRDLETRDAPVTRVFSQPGIFKIYLLCDGRKVDSANNFILSGEWFGFFQNGNSRFPGSVLQSDSSLELGHNSLIYKDTSGIIYNNLLLFDLFPVPSDDFTAVASFQCNKMTRGIPWYTSKVKILGTRGNIEIEVIDDQNPNNYVDLRHYYSEKSWSGINSDLRKFQVDMEKPVGIRIVNHRKKVTVYINEKQVSVKSYEKSLGQIVGLGFKSKGGSRIRKLELLNEKGKKVAGF
jgi:hypothetical protein